MGKFREAAEAADGDGASSSGGRRSGRASMSHPVTGPCTLMDLHQGVVREGSRASEGKATAEVEEGLLGDRDPAHVPDETEGTGTDVVTEEVTEDISAFVRRSLSA